MDLKKLLSRKFEFFSEIFSLNQFEKITGRMKKIKQRELREKVQNFRIQIFYENTRDTKNL